MAKKNVFPQTIKVVWVSDDKFFLVVDDENLVYHNGEQVATYEFKNVGTVKTNTVIV